MADREKLSSMLDALINNKPEEAQIAFHDYLGGKMKEEIHGEPAPDAGEPGKTDED